MMGRNAVPVAALYTRTVPHLPGTAAMMPCKAQLALIALVVVLGSMQMLASCGQKGDLYLPGDAPEERR